MASEQVEFPVPAALGGERVDRSVAMLTGLSRAEVSQLIDNGAVLVDSLPARSRGSRVSEGQVLSIQIPEVATAQSLEADPSVVFEVVHIDSDLLVIDKPAGLVVHPGSGVSEHTVVQGALALCPDIAELAGESNWERPGVVHRLDRGTSGLMVMARTQRAVDSLTDQLRARTATREYCALVLGLVEAEQGLIDAPLGRSGRDPTRFVVDPEGKEARTGYSVERRLPEPWPCTVVSCRLETGRTHQIRVHMAAISHPVIGDRRYGGQRSVAPPPDLDLHLGGDRPLLHARRLSFVHPSSGQTMAFDSPLPADISSVLNLLG